MTGTEEKWSARIAAWKASGKSIREFAEGEGFAISTFRWWSSRLKVMKRKAASPPRVAMARVLRTASPRLDARACVFVEVSGARIAVERGFDADLLRDVVSALGGAR
jgi:hypothetical protein